MSGWMILGLVLVILVLLGQIRVGAEAEYNQNGPKVKLRLGQLRFQVFPRAEKPPKEEKQPKPKKEKKKSDQPEKEQKAGGDPIALAREFIPLGLEAAGCFYHRLVMDRLELTMTVGGDDPADTALLYGRANAALGAMWRPLTQAFHVKDGRAHVEVDFNAPSTTVYGSAALSLKIGQVLWLAVYFGVKALRHFLHYRSVNKAKQQQRKAV